MSPNFSPAKLLLIALLLIVAAAPVAAQTNTPTPTVTPVPWFTPTPFPIPDPEDQLVDLSSFDFTDMTADGVEYAVALWLTWNSEPSRMMDWVQGALIAAMVLGGFVSIFWHLQAGAGAGDD